MQDVIDLNQILNRLPDLKGLQHHIAEVRGSNHLLPTIQTQNKKDPSHPKERVFFWFDIV